VLESAENSIQPCGKFVPPIRFSGYFSDFSCL
jgi:hypothetical protein